MPPSSLRALEQQSPLFAVARCQSCGRRVAERGCPAHGPIARDEESEAPGSETPPRIAGYRALAVIGRGGFGSVYRAEPIDGAGAVAIKVARADRPHAGAILRSEIAALKAIGPPHVPAIHAEGALDDGRPFVVMEHLAAPTLAERLAPEAGPVPLVEACALALAVIDALDALHARGYVHRDLKPENVFVDRLGRATLVDFGPVLREAEARRIAGDPSSDAGAVGTAEYMAPEQWAGRRDVDARADVYALGVILFELCAGVPPFWGPRAVVHEAHVGRRPPRLAALAEGRQIPPALEDVIARCLAKDPSDRYPDVRALRAALADVRRALAAMDARGEARAAMPSLAPEGAAPRASADRVTLGLLFFYADAEVPAVQARMIALGGQLAHGGAGRYVALFGNDAAHNPARRALRAAEEMLREGLCDRLRLDLAPVVAQPRRDGTKRFVSPLFARDDRYPSASDPPGITLSAAAAAVLDDVASGGGELVPVRAEDARHDDTTLTADVAVWPLIGRDAVMAALLASARAAAEDRAPTMARVVAPPGHGKSHLFREIARRLADLDVAEVLDVRAREPALGDVDHTLQELLRRALELPGIPPADGGAALLAERLGADGIDVAPAVALALGWVSAAAADTGMSTTLRALRAAPGALRAAVTVAAGAALAQRAAAKPLFVILDDAHFASDVLLSALEYAALAEGRAPLWICVLARPVFIDERPAWGDRAARREAYDLGPLDPASAASLCRRLLLPVESAPDSAVKLLVERAEAVPLLLVELVRGLRRRGIVRKSPKGEAYYLATDDLDSLPDLPLIEWLARSELDALAPALKEHARLVALLGPGTTNADVQGVIARLEAGGGGPDLPLDPRIGTARLVAAGLVIEDRDGRLAFRHELVREAVARATADTLRRRVHLAAAAHYADLPPRGADERRLAQLALHSSAAGMARVAERAYLDLAERARARHAYTEAERLYSRALEQPTSAAPDADLPPRRGAYRGRGLMRYRIGRYHDALTDFSCAREIAAERGDVEEQVEILLDEATAFDWMDEYASSEERVHQARALMPPAPSPLLEARMLLGLGRSALRASRNEEARAALARAATIAGPLGPEAYETLVVALMMLGFMLPALGEIDEARRTLDRVIALCEEHGDRVHLAGAFISSALFWGSLGDKAKMVADMARTLVLAREIGQGTLEFLAEFNLGEFLLLLDDAEAAGPHVARALDLDRKLTGDPVRPVMDLLAGRLALHVGDLPAARRIADRLRARDTAQRLADGRPLLTASDDVLCELLTLATSGADDGAWAELEARAVGASLATEHLEVIEARALAAHQRGARGDARAHILRALDAARRGKTPILPRLERRLADLDPAP